MFLLHVIIILTGASLNLDIVEGKPAGKVITIRQGDVRGRISTARGGRLFVDYWSIPYGKAKRFELAHPAPSWTGILEAYKKPEPCPYQDMVSGESHGSTEDCLFINVHTPKTHPKYPLKNLPVIVFIHGSFSDFQDQGGHFEGAKYFLDEDVVLVSFNYRLGILGFLTTSDEIIPANLGLKDQVLALKWVQKNIWLFGGDPGKVTLLGHGSGAAGVHYHILSKMSKGLFHKAILQSGNSLCPWAFVDEPDKTFINYASAMNCSDSLESGPVVECLRGKNASELVDVAAKANHVFNGNREETGNGVYFGPVVEHWMRNWPEKPAFIQHYPQNLVANWSNETMSAVPILMGANELDGVKLEWAEHVSRQFEPVENGSVWSDYKHELFGLFFGYTNRAGNKSDEIDEKVMQHYYFVKDGIEKDLGVKFFKALGHRHYFQCTRKAAVAHAKIAPTFLYYLTYNRNVSHLDLWMDKYGLKYDMIKANKTLLRGPVHGDELQYLFDLDESADFPLIRKQFRELSLEFSQNLVKMWINFARTGKPSGDWEPVSGDGPKWEELGDTRKPVDEPFKEHVDFWESLNLDGLRDLPPLRAKNDTSSRNGTKPGEEGESGEDGDFENSNDKYRDIIYVDAPGDDDGTGGLFNFPPLEKKT